MEDDVHVSHWRTFYGNGYGGPPMSIRLDRIIGTAGTSGDCALIVQGQENPIEISDTAEYVRDIVDAYHLFAS